MKTAVFIAFILWPCLKDQANTEKYPALIFNSSNRYLTSVEKGSPRTTTGFIGQKVCPAKNKMEQKFNEEHSLYNEALFWNGLEIDQNDWNQIDICDEPYKLSLAFSLQSEKWEFGFEIYVVKPVPTNFILVPFANYCSLKNYMELFSSSGKLYNHAIKSKNNELLLNGMELGFVWIPLFFVQLFNRQFRKVAYEISVLNAYPTVPECQDYSLGKELFDDIDLDLLYSVEAQKQLFKEVVLPSKSSEGSCEQDYKCLTKWLLIPPDQFRFGYSSPLFCSNMATIPIWNSTIGKIMQKVDEYLYTLYWISRKELHILAGVKNILQLPLQIPSWRKKHSPVILKRNDLTIEVPEIIYKMVTYKFIGHKKHKSNVYGVLIVIHNDPYFKKQICNDVSEELGWQEIRYETFASVLSSRTPSKFIYVCKISSSILLKLQLFKKKYFRIQELSLKKFPILNKNKEFKYEDFSAVIPDELKRRMSQDLDEKTKQLGNYPSRLVYRKLFDTNQF